MVAANVMPVLHRRATTPERFAESLATWLRKYDAVHVLADWPDDSLTSARCYGPQLLPC